MADEARITQLPVEVLDAAVQPVRLSQEAVEVMNGAAIPMRMSQLVVEILYQVGPPPPPPIPEPGPNPVPTILPSIRQWKLYRCDNKPRPEQSS